MARPLAPSKRLNTRADHIRRYADGMTALDIQRVTGWSKATFYRRRSHSDFPASSTTDRKVLWNALQVYEWLSRFNLKAIMSPDEFKKFETDLSDRSFADPSLQYAYGRIVEREQMRRKYLAEDL